MHIRLHFIALSIFICQVLLLATASANQQQTVQASTDDAVSLLQASNSSLSTQARAGDAIQQFVRADFAGRRDMLNQWPADIATLDRLVAYIDNNQLYRDNAGQTYILKDDQTLLSYPDEKVLAQWPADLSQVSLVNTLRKALNFGQAKIKLQSEDSAQRLKAIDILENNLSELDIANINRLYQHEKNNKVKARLAQLQARLEFNRPDLQSKRAAIATLADSNRPDVLAMFEQALQQPDLDPELKAAISEAHSSIQTRIQASEWTGHLFSGLSSASILLLAALGLAITYGLLGVINMAHGELIMIGAYTTYVVQSLFKSYLGAYVDWYLLAAIPAAFLVSALIGMLIERTVIQPLYGRQLETLLATFGVSLILMQLVRMVFGAQNVEVSNIAWLSGGIAITPSLMLPYNRIAIVVFTLLILLLLVYLLNKTRFGLFVRAVTQNRQMARAVGIRSARVDMLAFGLGSGLAGLAGCALAQVGNVGPDLGQNYIIDAFLVVVVGGVGQVLGAVLAALGLGISGTVLEIGMGAVLAKICLLVLVILFIQKRPQGLFAIKGRFVE
ncbi:amino acid/amide ABC transporter membrane protein 1 (HAAT family) [Acinetobacter calcoaceticus]|uniref:Amino acid/amide ABC transporter membrane protein 1 (HAAT family) n=1 Tax=Acinetobacter calcoaceticus TaxID=471 RepID=A0A4V2R170_ACICA|nr:amino acid/amide ABC transporter membrane protein 1 (HAAT family) [Acinetobacter calcoaceticus]